MANKILSTTNSPKFSPYMVILITKVLSSYNAKIEWSFYVWLTDAKLDIKNSYFTNINFINIYILVYQIININLVSKLK